MTARRSYGSGRVYVRTDSAGRETYYGSWWSNGRRINRKLGSKRERGKRHGLTAVQAEAELRRLMREVEATPTVDRLNVSEVGQLYLAHLTALGRKRSTLTAVEMTLRIWIEPHLGDRAIRRSFIKRFEGFGVESVGGVVEDWRSWRCRPGSRSMTSFGLRWSP